MVREEDLFINPTRRNLYHHILAYPGVSLSLLKKIFGLSEGTLRYHLHCLEKGAKIRSRIDSGKRCYYPADVSSIEVDIRSDFPGIKLSIKEKRILTTINRNPGIDQNHITNLLKMNRFTLGYNIRSLIEKGLIMKWRDGRNTRYRYISRNELNTEIFWRASIDLLKGKISEKKFKEINKKVEEND